jgi:hypothetical protein
MGKSIREIVAERLKGFEYRQEARNRERAAEKRSRKKSALGHQQGTLKGARLYFELKGIQVQEARDSATGCVRLVVPGQLVLTYDAEGRYVGSGPDRS